VVGSSNSVVSNVVLGSPVPVVVVSDVVVSEKGAVVVVVEKGVVVVVVEKGVVVVVVEKGVVVVVVEKGVVVVVVFGVPLHVLLTLPNE